MTKPWAIISIVCLGFFLRAGGLWYGLPSKTGALTTYHPDEALSYQTLADIHQKGILNYTPGREFFWGTVHLYALGAALKCASWTGLLQVASREEMENNVAKADRLYEIGRSLSVLAGTASILVLYYALLPWGKKAALFAALALALVPVHVCNSFFVRPDALMLLLNISVMAFSLKFLETGARKFLVLSGLLTGLSAATKYSGGSMLIMPLAAAFLYYRSEKKFVPFRELLILGGCMASGFLLGCPTSVTRFPAFWEKMSGNIEMASTSDPLEKPGWILYLTQLLPLGCGWPLYLSAIAGMGVVLYKRTSFGLLMIASGIFVFVLTSLSKHQVTLYTLPFVVFIAVFAGIFFDFILSLQQARAAALSLTVAAFAWSSVYSAAYLRLYYEKNVREDASEWIEKNIPSGTAIGIARSYFWTPGILRQYHPPYPVLMGGDLHSGPADFIMGLERVVPKAPFIVLTEYEYGFLTDGQERYPEPYRVMKKITEEKYELAARFKRTPHIFSISFEQKFLPDDWLNPNPEILVYKRIGS